LVIKFGTSGWRGIISDDFTFDGVRRAAQAISDYAKRKERALLKNGLLIGYDTRFLSEKYAYACAEVISSNGLRVVLTKRDTPTPVISYEIIKKKFAGGINITASHNPPNYNGIKFSPSWGGPALPETTKMIEALANNPGIRVKAGDSSRIRMEDFCEDYLKDIRNKVDMKLIKKAGIKAGMDPLYGTGRGYLDVLLRECCRKVMVFHDYRDALFGGSSPEPAPEKLQELISAIRSQNLTLGLSTDGDADRFGILDRDGTFLTPNEVLSMLLLYLKKSRGWKGCVVRSVATTHLIDRIAVKYGISIRETPVGFKYIGEIMVKEPMIIGGEESGGLTVLGHVPEKDGILACMLMLEMSASEKKSFRDILKGIYKEVGYVTTGRDNIRLEENAKTRLIVKLRDDPPKAFGAFEVSNINTTDGFKFLLKGGSWLMIRLSGTEPLVRCYTEADSAVKLKALRMAGAKFIGAI